MNIQIYAAKKNFDAQKAERYFKERRIPVAFVDMKKHKPGARELALFARAAGGVRALVDADAKGDRADYARQLSVESVLTDVLLETPALLVSPIVRNGNQVTIGYQPQVWEGWK